MPVKLGGNILVTGSSRGIGLELVRQLVQTTGDGDHIYASCRDPAKAEALRELASENPKRVTVIKLDTGDESSISAAVQALGERVATGGMNLIINNAAINKPEVTAPLSDVSASDMMEVYRVNVVGPFLLAKYLLPHLKRAAEQHGGQGGPMSSRRAGIINITSQYASLTDCPELFRHPAGNVPIPMYPYRTSKTALNMLTCVEAEELREHHILATTIFPGWVRTDMGTEVAPLTPQESVKAVLGVVSSLSDKDSGSYLSYEGKPVPW